jgi:hypothetical protein
MAENEELEAIHEELPDTKTLIRETRIMADAAEKTAAAAMREADAAWERVKMMRNADADQETAKATRNEVSRPWWRKLFS